MKRDLVKRHLAQLAAAGDIEDVCLGCGRCCHFKTWRAGHLVESDVPCPHLTPQNRCDCYATRLEVATCLTLQESIVRGEMPRSCPYVAGLAGYRGPSPSVAQRHT